MSVTLVQNLVGHTDVVWSVCWNKKGTLLASCSSDKEIRLWTFQDNNWICENILTGAHERTIRFVSFSNSGDKLGSASFDSTVAIWTRSSSSNDSSNNSKHSNTSKHKWKCALNLEGHENECKSIEWSYDDRFIATCSRDKTVWIWEQIEDNEFECASVLTHHSQDVKKVIWHPSQYLLVSCSYDNTIKFYSESISSSNTNSSDSVVNPSVDDDWQCIDTLEGHESTVWSISFDRSGDRLASCSDDCTVKIWSLHYEQRKWLCIATLSGYHKRTIYDISWSPVTNLLATASGDDSICIFSVSENFREATESNELNVDNSLCNLVTRVESAHSKDVNTIKWHPIEGDLLACGGDDYLVKLWRIKT